MELSRDIAFQGSVDTSIQNISTYWKNREMKFVECSETYIRGKQGSWLGNLFPFKMKKIISEVEIIKQPQNVRCKLTVNKFGQYITQSNRNFFDLELENFEKYLLLGTSDEDAWIIQRCQSKREHISFLFACFLIAIVRTVSEQSSESLIYRYLSKLKIRLKYLLFRERLNFVRTIVNRYVCSYSDFLIFLKQ